MSELALKLIKEAKEKRLTRLDLGNCGLTELPEELFELVWLETLYLNDKITSFSHNTEKCPETFSNISNNISNSISFINQKILKLSNLKKISLSGNIINSIEPLSELIKLVHLDISNTPVIDLSPIKKLKNLQIFDISNTNVIELSPIENLSELECLNLSNNKISDFTPIRYLQKLKILDISNTNTFDTNFLEELKYLERLNLSSNNLSEIKPLSSLSRLWHLDISKTDIKNIQPLFFIENLRWLNLSNTKIENIKPLYGNTNLQKLDISETLIKDLEPLRKLSKIYDLNISNTYVQNLKPLRIIIGKGVSIKNEEININNNGGISTAHSPITNPPKPILVQGNEAILRYWQELENKETITNNQTKLIFVGNSRAGKTSLWQFLKDKIYNEQADSTHGIKTEIWDTETLGTQDNQNLAAHIWDFGGQEYYHATHRLFLADNAVYVLVWEKDNNKQGTRLEKFKLDDNPNGEIEEVELEHFPASYWLENIAYFAGKHCPVLIVQNKVDEEAQKANYTEGVSETSDCFHLSVQNAYGFQQGNLTLKRHDLRFQDFKERLLELLRQNATAFKLVKYYAQVREALEAKAHDTEYIAVSELKDIALQFDETPDLENLLAYLKSFTNTVLYFKDNPKLNDRLYLNPTHISRDIYKILNKTVRENSGKFDVVHIQKRLNCDALDAERFVALMTEFDLIFEKSKTKAGENLRQFVTPQYLPKYEDLDDTVHFLIEGYEFKTSFFIKFKSFVPRSMMLRFIAQNGAYANQETYWRNGIIYKSSFSHKMIKVEYDHEQLTFSIFVQEKDTQKIDMQNIVAQFVKLNDSDDKIEISNEGNTYFELRKIYMAYDQKRKEIDNNEGQYTSISNFDWLFEKHKMKEDNFISSNIESQPTHSSANLKILMLTANPPGQRPLEISKEQAEINYKLQEKPNKFQLITKRSVSISEFKEFIEQNKPNILHFSGHGEGDGSQAGIVVHNDDKNKDELITLDGLDALFEYLTDCNIKLDAILLNACFSEEQSKIISKYVPIVIGTSISIGDKLAIAFSIGFYFKLAELEQADYELAFKSGRTQAVLKGASKANFVLFKNGSKVEF